MASVIRPPIDGGADARDEWLGGNESHSRKRKDNWRHTPIIARIAQAMKGDKQPYLAAGMDAFVTSRSAREHSSLRRMKSA